MEKNMGLGFRVMKWKLGVYCSLPGFRFPKIKHTT